MPEYGYNYLKTKAEGNPPAFDLFMIYINILFQMLIINPY